MTNVKTIAARAFLEITSSSYFQNKGNAKIFYSESSTEPTDGGSGFTLQPMNSEIWVKGDGGNLWLYNPNSASVRVVYNAI